MKLLVDVGNYRVKWTLAEGDRLESPRTCDAAECASAWADLAPERAIFSSVASPDVTGRVVTAFGNTPSVRIHARATGSGVTSAYPEPRMLGDDRWANLVAARAAFPGHDLLIVDAGTAVTVDYLDATGHFPGGAILAGYQALRAGLSVAAPALPAIGGEPVLPARNTPDAVAGGAWFGLAGAVERVARQLAPDPERCIRLLTGGDARALRPFLTAEWTVDPLLTLRGLLVAEEDECAGSHYCSCS